MLLDFFKKKKLKKSTEKSFQEFDDLWNTDIEDIWEVTNPNQFIIAMNGYIGRKCGYGDKMEELTAEQRVFYISMQLLGEVDNGGFSQFFFNYSGIFANELEHTFTEIGAEEIAEICKRAVSLVYGENVPADRAEREEILLAVNDETSAMLSECDKEIYEHEDGIEELLYTYIHKNKAVFS